MQPRKQLRVWIPSNRAYTEGRNAGKPAPMDGLNELIASSRTDKYVGARKERENVEHCALFVRLAMRRCRYRPMTEGDRQRCDVEVVIHETSRRRDVPNVVGGVLKYVLDALTARHKGGAAAIWDDSVRWIRYVTPHIVIDPDSPGVEVTVIPIEEKK